jgi:UDP-N-acetylglucosamine 2-epimerase (non-hydrolysing)
MRIELKNWSAMPAVNPEIKILHPAELKNEIAVIVGTRPGIVMFAPIIHQLRKENLGHFVVHTGQHYSPNMDEQFFEDLELPAYDYRLDGVADKKTHGSQTAAMLEGIEQILLQRLPRLVLVGGDANTNLAGALAARKLQIKVGHVEAGERSYDWRMPEEHNRVMIDHISDYLFITNEKAADNLKAERIRGKICQTGNPIVDASRNHLDIARQKSDALARLQLAPGKYALMTSHREENVDVKENLKGELQGVSEAASEINLPVLFLAHPRTLKRLNEFKMTAWANSLPGITITEGVGYLDFLCLIANARLVFTDSGGVQQEACIHHVPCVTLRDNTEWTETLNHGANRLAGCHPQTIRRFAKEAMQVKAEWEIPFGDGDAAAKIVEVAKMVLHGSKELEEVR